MASFSNSGVTPVKACSLSGTDFILDLEHNSGKARGLDDLAKTVKTLLINRLIIGGCAGLSRHGRRELSGTKLFIQPIRGL